MAEEVERMAEEVERIAEEVERIAEEVVTREEVVAYEGFLSARMRDYAMAE